MPKGSTKAAVEFVLFETRTDWRNWLVKNGETVKSVWLVFLKRKKQEQSFTYDDALEEALCHGWIDGLIKRIDNEKYARKFMQRVNHKNWSPRNIEIVKRLIASGEMTPRGLAKLEAGILDRDQASRREFALDDALVAILKTNQKAWEFLSSISPSQRKRYVGWIMSAKKEETRRRRLQEAMVMLEKNELLEGK